MNSAEATGPVAAPKSPPTSGIATNGYERLPSAGPGQARDSALDFTKGILVLLMVLYHWLNYFVSAYGFGYRYIPFITPSFVFLAGFLVTYLLFDRAGRSASSLALRLVVRGVKLLALFAVLNLGAAWLMPGGHRWHVGFLEAIRAAHVTGQAVSFLVLLPIGYTLMLAGLFQKARALRGVHVLVTIGAAFVVVSGLVLWGVRSPVLELTGAGLLGLVIGQALAYHRDLLRRWWPWFALGYVPHIVALTVWGVPYALQLVSVCLNLALFYCLGGLMRPSSATGRVLLLLGQYSLLAYVGQIAVLQLLVLAFRPVQLGAAEAPFALAAALLLTIAGIAAVDWLRDKSRAVDSLYRLVFA